MDDILDALLALETPLDDAPDEAFDEFVARRADLLERLRPFAPHFDARSAEASLVARLERVLGIGIDVARHLEARALRLRAAADQADRVHRYG